MFGDLIDDPLDVELGALSRLVNEKKVPLTPKEDNQLDAFKKIRNNLAHLRTLDYDQVMWVLSQKI